MKTKKAVEITLDLGELKAAVVKIAKDSGVSADEFIRNVIESRIRQDADHKQHGFVRHGGKHLMGKHTGYEVADGKYYPSRTWTQQFEFLFAQRVAVQNLLNAVLKQSQERAIEIEAAIMKAQNDMVDDLGLDPTKQWVYYGSGKYLQEEAPEKEEQEK